MGKRTTFMRVLRNDGSRTVSAAWAAHPHIDKEIADHIFFGRESGESESDGVALSRYDWNADYLSEPKAVFPMEEGSPRKIAVHPTGDAVVVSFSKGCRLFEWEELPEDLAKGDIDMKLIPSDRVLNGLHEAGPQNCLMFGGNGTLLASGGEDGHVRVFKWPSLEIVLDVPNAHKSIKDIDISLDSAFLSTTAENSPCRVWDLSKSTLLATLPFKQGESFGLCRFSRDGTKPFLFVTITKERAGLIGVWDLSDWRRLGVKQFLDDSITALAITHHGKRLAIGSLGGDISIIEVKKMEVQQLVKNGHLKDITLLEFSLNDKAILSLSSDYSTRVTAIDLSRDWKEWQLYLVMLGMMVVSILLFYLLYEFGDAFWQLPGGKLGAFTPQAQRYDDLVDYKSEL